ncbi:hypothetical protein CRG98_006532 [Punica granatum]|uniref:Uncharacterized protein n=1 Tax=Punica granatum TaxID=22663 RepID=A0A2I0KX46_PUNGR|nr:hypothetical protein CRG98_006532 [Punica granatum]
MRKLGNQTWIGPRRSFLARKERESIRPPPMEDNPPNSSKSRVIYLTSRYEERVGEVFKSRGTRLNAWKGARVQRIHVWARMGTQLGVRENARAQQGVRRAGRCSGVRVRGSARVLFTREHGLRHK